MIDLQCKIEIPQVQGLQDNELTVGREFLFVCDGEFPKDLAQDKLSFIKTPEMKYQIKLLGFEFRSPTQADIKATSYVVGPLRLPQLQLTDGNHILNLGDQAFTLATVIQPPKQGAETEAGTEQQSGQPQQAQQQVQPFPAMGPMNIPVPSLYWAILGVVLGGLFVTIFYKIFRVIQRKNMLERLKQYDSVQSPEQQYHASYRKLQRTSPVFYEQAVSSEDVQAVVSDTMVFLKTYLTRKYKVPALECNDRLILKDLKKYHSRTYEEHQKDLEKILREYSLALKDQGKLTKVDAKNLANNSRALVEKLESFS